MVLIYLYDQRPDLYVALDLDEANDEITQVVYANLTDEPVTVTYDWKNKAGQTVVIPAGTAESSIGIPPGQRKFLPVTGGRGGYDSELAYFSLYPGLHDEPTVNPPPPRGKT